MIEAFTPFGVLSEYSWMRSGCFAGQRPATGNAERSAIAMLLRGESSKGVATGARSQPDAVLLAASRRDRRQASKPGNRAAPPSPSPPRPSPWRGRRKELEARRRRRGRPWRVARDRGQGSERRQHRRRPRLGLDGIRGAGVRDGKAERDRGDDERGETQDVEVDVLHDGLLACESGYGPKWLPSMA